MTAVLTTLNDFAGLLFLMMAGHAVADFALQSPHHSNAKYPGNTTGIPWFVGMGNHALIHGGAVAIITGFWWLGASETLAHTVIDYGKHRKWWGTVADQLAHIGCKIIWATIAIIA